MKKLFYPLIIALLAIALLVPGAVSAHTEEVPYSTPLIAGQHIDVGDVSVWNDGTNLHVTYTTTDGWYMTETHLAVADGLGGIPQTKTENPIPGKFAYSENHDPAVQTYTYTIPLSWDPGNDLYVAAHAVVEKVTVITAAPYYASAVFSSSQELRKDGSSVLPVRSVPEQGLVFESGQNQSNFFSLGFGGEIVVEFACPIQNGEGNDVKVIEDTWGSYPLETANVFASQDGENWTFLGEADNTNNVGIHTISEFDLGALASATYIKVVDTSNPADHNNAADGYDLNAVEALHDCIEIQKETAWGEGNGFEGKNWAMYFTYTVQEVGLELRANPPTWGVPASGSPVVGFATLGNDTAGEVAVTVSLTEGSPGRTYGVFLEEYQSPTPDGNMPLWKYIGNLTTDSNGDGSFTGTVALSSGTHYLQVVLSYPWGSWGAQSFGTDIAQVIIQ